MILAICIDDNGGMLFNHRRQSQDRVLRADLLSLAAGSGLWMNAYSQKQFAKEETETVLHVDEQFLDQAGQGDYCFVEDTDPEPWLDRAEGLVLYRWNRVYPADRHLSFDPAALGWTLSGTVEFPGYSHEKITKEVYTK